MKWRDSEAAKKRPKTLHPHILNQSEVLEWNMGGSETRQSKRNLRNEISSTHKFSLLHDNNTDQPSQYLDVVSFKKSN